MSLAVFLDTEVGYGAGPAWWLILAAALLLVLGAALAYLSVRAKARLRRTRSAAAAAGLVVVAIVAWIVSGPVSTDFGWWLYVNFAGLLLSAACLPLAVLDLNPAQRIFGLAAVTTTGAWLATAMVEGLIVSPSGSQPGALLAAVVSTLLAVGGAWLGQRRPTVLHGAAAG